MALVHASGSLGPYSDTPPQLTMGLPATDNSTTRRVVEQPQTPVGITRSNRVLSPVASCYLLVTCNTIHVFSAHSYRCRVQQRVQHWLIHRVNQCSKTSRLTIMYKLRWINERRDTDEAGLKDTNYLFTHTNKAMMMKHVFLKQRPSLITQAGTHQTINEAGKDTEEQTCP